MRVRTLAPLVQTLYAELVEQLATTEVERSIGALRGSFASKKVKGRTYWYLQVRELGVQRQHYVGPDTPELRGVIERWQHESDVRRQDAASRQRLVAMLLAAGAWGLDRATGGVLEMLAGSGLFRLDAVLIGTQAFRLYGNLLGVRWEDAALSTQDIDVAQAASVAVTLPVDSTLLRPELPALLQRVEAGLTPIPRLDPREPSTSFRLGGRELRLDLLTPLVGPERDLPIPLPAIGAWAQPLRFLDYLIAEPVMVAALYRDGIPINVPSPARFAWHKLLVAARRPVQEESKRKKDLRQAEALLSLLVDERPGDVRLAWDDLARRGARWVAGANAGLASLEDRDLRERARSLQADGAASSE